MSTPFDPFSTKNLLDLPELSTDATKAWSGFVFDTGLQSDLLTLTRPDQLEPIEFQPEILKLAIDHVPSLDLGFDKPAVSPDVEEKQQHTAHTEQEIEDVWKIKDLHVKKHEVGLVSWDNFHDLEHEEPSCAFTSEAGPAVFDALLRKVLPRTHNDQTRYVKPDILLAALFDLGLGRNSVLFRWHEQGRRFESQTDNYTTSGLSKDAVNNIATLFMDSGTRLRKLKAFAQSHEGHSPTKIALQTALASVIHVLEHVVEASRHDTRSLLQLQETFHQPFILLQILDRLSQITRSISDDSDLASAILVLVDQVATELPQFEQIMNSIIAYTLQPSLERLQTEIGLASLDRNQKADAKAISALLPDATAKTFEQARDALQVLRLNSTEHVMFVRQSSTNNTLSVKFSPEAMVLAQQRAKEYEDNVRNKILSTTVCDTRERVTTNGQKSTANPNGPFDFNFDLFDLASGDSNIVKDRTEESLQLQVQRALTAKGDASGPTIVSCRQAIDLSVNPILGAQHRLLSYSVLQILFRDHKLVPHMDLLGRFELLCDGTFVSKLHTALFDSEQVSGEGKRTTYAKTGLRVQSREAWPPASSELRLALMGILSESMSTVNDTALTESTSFAIRDMSDEDLERCRDIDSIYALDFLRLNYKPPTSAIESVIPSNCLDSYDRVFNQLLRLLRIKALTQSMLRHRRSHAATPELQNHEHKFRVEAHRFTSSLAEYYHNTVIRGTWLSFMATLRDIEDSLSRDDYDGTLRLAPGLVHLRDLHERTLDTIVRGMLLKRRHTEIKGVLDRLFEVILRFAAVASKPRAPVVGVDDGDDDDDNSASSSVVRQLRRDFQGHVATLVRHLRAEVARAEDGADVFERLLLGLDWNGYWSRTGR